MTIASTTNRVDYTGNGATDTYPYTFRIFAESDLLVTQRDTDNIETTLVLNTDYTVTGVGVGGGGNVVLTAGNLTTDYHLTIRRVRLLTQNTDIRNQGDFYPETHEDTFDHLMMVDQQQQDEIDRSVKVSETFTGLSLSLPGPEAGKAIFWNDAADALENKDPGDATLQIPADNSVTTAKLVDLSVTTAKLADDAVTADKISDADLLAIRQKLDIQSEGWIVISSDATEADYATFAAYVAGTPTVGDKVLLKVNEVISSKITIPNGILIKQIESANFTCSADLTTVLEFSSNIMIEGNLKIQTSHTGTIAEVIKLNGDNCGIPLVNITNTSTGTITNAISIAVGKEGNYINAVIAKSAGTISNMISDSSGNNSNFYVIRDTINNVLLPLTSGSKTGFMATTDKDKLDSLSLEGNIKAWVNFNGTGTVAIRDSFNVSSVDDNNIGDYTINFTTSFANTNYAMAGFAQGSTGASAITFSADSGFTMTASAKQIKTRTDINAPHDPAICTALFIGDQ